MNRTAESGSVMIAVLIFIVVALLIGAEILYGLSREIRFSGAAHRQMAQELQDRFQFQKALEEIAKEPLSSLLQRAVDLGGLLKEEVCTFASGREAILASIESGSLSFSRNVHLVKLPENCFTGQEWVLLEAWWFEDGRRYRALLSQPRQEENKREERGFKRISYQLQTIEEGERGWQLVMDEGRYLLPVSQFRQDELLGGRVREFKLNDEKLRLFLTSSGRIIELERADPRGYKEWEMPDRFKALFSESIGFREILDWQEVLLGDVWRHLLLLGSKEGLEEILLFNVELSKKRGVFPQRKKEVSRAEVEWPHLKIYGQSEGEELHLAVAGLDLTLRAKSAEGAYYLWEDRAGEKFWMILNNHLAPKYYGAYLLQKSRGNLTCIRGTKPFREKRADIPLGCVRPQIGDIERVF